MKNRKENTLFHVALHNEFTRSFFFSFFSQFIVFFLRFIHNKHFSTRKKVNKFHLKIYYRAHYATMDLLCESMLRIHKMNELTLVDSNYWDGNIVFVVNMLELNLSTFSSTRRRFIHSFSLLVSSDTESIQR